MVVDLVDDGGESKSNGLVWWFGGALVVFDGRRLLHLKLRLDPSLHVRHVDDEM